MARQQTVVSSSSRRGSTSQAGFKTEYSVRKAHALERAFTRVRRTSDWLRGSQGKGWVSKVDWAIQRKIDPRCTEETQGFMMRELEDEVRESANRDSMMAIARSKLAEFEAAPLDPLNPSAN